MPAAFAGFVGLVCIILAALGFMAMAEGRIPWGDTPVLLLIAGGVFFTVAK